MTSKCLIAVAVTATLLLPGMASSAVYTEVGDAPEGLFFGDNQETTGTGPLTAISGTLGNGDGTWDANDDHVDAFRIKVTDVAAFFASLVTADGGSFVGGGGLNDSALYLFNLGGDLIMANDDKPVGAGGVLQSFLSDPTTFPGGLTNSPGNVVAGTDYVLAVTYATNTLLDLNDVPVVDFSGSILDLDGINPLSSGIAARWRNSGAPSPADNDFAYTIALGGTTFSDGSVIPPSPVPVPASLSLLLTGLFGVGLIARRRKNAA